MNQRLADLHARMAAPTAVNGVESIRASQRSSALSTGLQRTSAKVDSLRNIAAERQRSQRLDLVEEEIRSRQREREGFLAAREREKQRQQIRSPSQTLSPDSHKSRVAEAQQRIFGTARLLDDEKAEASKQQPKRASLQHNESKVEADEGTQWKLVQAARHYAEVMASTDDVVAHREAEGEMREALFAEVHRRVEFQGKIGTDEEEKAADEAVKQCSEEVRQIIRSVEEELQNTQDSEEAEKIAAAREKAAQRKKAWEDEEAARRAERERQEEERMAEHKAQQARFHEEEQKREEERLERSARTQDMREKLRTQMDSSR